MNLFTYLISVSVCLAVTLFAFHGYSQETQIYNVSSLRGDVATDVRQVKPRKVVLKEDGSVEAVGYEIEFSDSTALKIAMRPWVYETFFEVEMVGEKFDDLEFKAKEGNAPAALELVQALVKCTYFGFQTEEELNQALTSLEETHSFTRAIDGMVVSLSPDQNGSVDVLSERLRMESSYRNCEGISRDQYLRIPEFRNMAIEAGSLSAIRTRAQRLPRNEEKFSLYLRAWKLGDYNASGWLSKSYEEGWAVGGSDPVRSYAYALLADKLRRIALSDPDGRVSPFYERLRADAKLEERSNMLSHSENARAVLLAKEILSQNKKCCLGLWQGDRRTSPRKLMIDHN
ncbi:MAG: hypothetical protein JKY88_03330 [Pseudomonadales bacterium]|nr:hypothetical protein [Pseudomonadales bacterium]